VADATAAPALVRVVQRADGRLVSVAPDARVPLDRRLYKLVRLVSVE